jgi:hypothetical protein
MHTTITRTALGLATVALAAGATIGTASATPAARGHQTSAAAAPAALPPTVEEGCGYLGSALYRHCDGGSGSTVMLDVETFWGGHGQYCVGPGTTNLQPVYRWAVTGAWWNGGWGCQPGKYS